VANKTISSEDRDLFHQTVGKVRAINTDKILPGPTAKPKPFPNKSAVNVHEQLSTLPLDYDIEEVSLGDSLSYLAPGLQTKVLKKLKQGHFGAAAELDLHGLTSSDAKQQLLTFLHLCMQNGFRCAHIIHGKGYRSSDNRPVLKNHLNLWLRQHQNVLAFCSATPKQGGTGAVLVLLQSCEKS